MQTWQALATHQSGVVSRPQLLKAGLAVHDIRRLLRRREIARLHPGVYLDHTGDPSWLQRAWGGVLLGGPGAALVGTSALRAVEGPGRRSAEERTIHVGVPHQRRPGDLPGVEFTRMRALADRAQFNTSPPRLRYPEAALDVAAVAADDLAALEVLTRAVQSGRTTAGHLLGAMDSRAALARRPWLQAVLEDIAHGTCSVLEHGYLTRVERPHGLLGARRQVRDRVNAASVYRDVVYRILVVEIDGALFHGSLQQRTLDLRRDLATQATRGVVTVRVGYGQVFGHSCETALHIGALLDEPAQPCSSDCIVGRSGATG